MANLGSKHLRFQELRAFGAGRPSFGSQGLWHLDLELMNLRLGGFLRLGGLLEPCGFVSLEEFPVFQDTLPLPEILPSLSPDFRPVFPIVQSSF